MRYSNQINRLETELLQELKKLKAKERGDTEGVDKASRGDPKAEGEASARRSTKRFREWLQQAS